MKPNLFKWRALVLEGLLLFFALCPLQVKAGTGTDARQQVELLLRQGNDAVAREHYARAAVLYQRAYLMAVDTRQHEQEFWAVYNLGVCYYYVAEYGEALNKYYQASKLCDDYSLSSRERMYVLNAIAGVYFEEGNYHHADSIIRGCIATARRHADWQQYCNYVLDLALIYNKQHQYERTERCLAEVRRHLPATDTINYYKVGTIECERLYRLHLYDSLIALAPRVLGSHYVIAGDKAIILVYLINVYVRRSQFALAERYAVWARRITPVQKRPDLYNALSYMCQRQGNFARALQFKDSVLFYSDSLVTLNNRQLSESSRVKIEMLKMQQQMSRREASLRHRRWLATSFAVFIVVVMVFVVILMRRKIQQQKQAHELTMLRMQQKETEMRHQHELTARTLEQKKQELSTLALFVSARNQLIDNLLKAIEKIRQSYTVPELNTIAQQLRQTLSNDNQQQEFLVKFESANAGFMRQLHEQHPELSVSDLRFLAYIHMNLSTKDISSLLNINPDSCKRRKIRISKKLQLESSTQLYDFLQQFG